MVANRGSCRRVVAVMVGCTGLSCAFWLGGCASTTGAFEPEILSSEGQGVLYVYRVPSGLGGGSALPVYVDQVHVGSLGAGRYLAVHVEPGGRIVRVEGRSDAVREVWVWAGESVFLELSVGVWSGLPHIDELSTDEARRRISRTRKAGE